MVLMETQGYLNSPKVLEKPAVDQNNEPSSKKKKKLRKASRDDNSRQNNLATGVQGSSSVAETKKHAKKPSKD